MARNGFGRTQEKGFFKAGALRPTHTGWNFKLRQRGNKQNNNNNDDQQEVKVVSPRQR